MKKLFAAAWLAASLLPCSAYASPPSAASIETLFEATRAESLLETIYGNLENMMRQSMQAAVQGRAPLSEAQQRVFEQAPRRLAGVMREEMSWAKLKPGMARIYAESFTQAEIDGLIAFYRSPAGRAFVEKMPAVSVRSMQLSQEMMRSFMPKVEAAMRDAFAEAGLQPR